MKYFLISFLCFSIYCNAQITGNPQVKDSNAISLDSDAVNSLIGKWKLEKTVENVRSKQHVRDRGMIFEFDKEGNVINSWCNGCHQEKAGQWKVVNEESIKFDDMKMKESMYLAGDWVVYKLTDQEMVLAKVLTSSGDWTKLHYFSKNIGNPPTTAIDRYCINCTEGGSCWGDRPEEAQRQLVFVTDLVDNEGEKHQNSAEIQEKYDRLLNNAPCMGKHLYLSSVKYYEKLLKDEKNEQMIKPYKEKIKQIKEQQQLYFN